MLKKAMSYILSIGILLAAVAFPAAAEISFSDLGSSHWSYESVSKLVNDGTISGYEDGTFRPDNTVTRAEFVKMIGKGPVKRETDFSDVPKEHWGYEYIMYSGLKGSGNNFEPDRPITRGETAELLWSRAGEKKGEIAPSIITKQSSNQDAVAWLYNNSIMIGNDGVDLRLGDTLSRAEAAALIIRSRETDGSSRTSFSQAISDEVAKTVFTSMKLFDNKEYSPDKTVTNGELARAALRLASEEYNLTYSSFPIASQLEHTYGRDITIIGKECLGEDKITAAFADQTANKKDAVCALVYGMIKKSHATVSLGNIDNYYKDLSGIGKDKTNVILTYAYTNGIQLFDDGNIKGQEAVTLKEISAILIQLENICGSQTVYSTEKNERNRYIAKDSKISYDLASYPAAKDKYQYILKDVPNAVYNAPIAFTGSAEKFGLPRLNFDFAREFSDMFLAQLDKIVAAGQEKFGITLRFEYYPSLVFDNGEGFTIRTKCIVVNNPKNVSYQDLFGDRKLTDDIPAVPASGTEFFVDIKTSYVLF